MPLTDIQAITASLMWLEPLKKGESPLQYKAIASNLGLDVRDEVIGTAIRRAFKNGWVSATRTSLPVGVYTRNEALSNRLLAQYHIPAVSVIDAPEFTSDMLHAALGYEMAKLLSLPDAIESGQVIGIGSGRGPFYTARALETMPNDIPMERLTIVSLTGHVFAGGQLQEASQILDADLHAAMLCNALGGATVRPVGAGIGSAKSGTWLNDTDYLGCIPDRCIVGVGVLVPGHRFHDAITRWRQDGSDSGGIAPFERVLEDLAQLVTLSDEVMAASATDNESYYCPVGDICNRLYYIEPPPNVAVPQAAQIKDLVERVNSKLLTVDEEQLKLVRKISLVAGTRQKSAAIATILGQYNVRALATDSQVAEELLSQYAR